MTLSTLRLALVAGFAAPFALATASLAQPAPPMPSPDAADAGHHHWDPAPMRAHMAEHLRTVLQLQPGQDAALDAFLDAMKPPEGMMDRKGHEPGADEHLTTPERLDKMLAHMDERRARFAQVAAATKQFYAALSPAQQKAFDAIGMGHGDHHGMMGDHRDHGVGDRDGDHDRGQDEMGPDGRPHG